MKRLSLVFGLLLTFCGSLIAREFTVLTYNVENLFDVDGVALYSDYELVPSGKYGSGPLMGKLESIRTALAAVNDGAGPEVILFQELELDRTPYGTPTAAAFLKETQGLSLEELFRDDPQTSELPSELLLLKYLEDNGLTGYHIAQPDAALMETHPPHKNVVFSKFPIKYIRQRPMLQARDLLVVGLDVEGHELIVLNNHWKSGASDPVTEGIRVQNARVVRAELEAILFGNPRADVIIAGDLNSYYNHKAANPGLKETGVDDALQAGGYESRMVGEDAAGLYNLWYELPAEQRGSEVYRGSWGTLMQMILTPGLYDQRGIQYIDNSFNRLMLPGINVDSQWQRPISWTNYGGGAGFSDHLPIYARFRVVPGAGEDGWMSLSDPTNEASTAARPVVDYSQLNPDIVPDVYTMASMSEGGRAGQIGQLFKISQPLSGGQPARIKVGDLELELYSPLRAIRDALNALQAGEMITVFADLDDYRGNLQLVIQDKNWITTP
jgi:endonuclease/exonuclease/phosphatase family metal-dependent hydrolase